VKISFQKLHPEVFFLDGHNLESLSEYLQSRGWLLQSERVVASAHAGAGNMNYTLRVRTSDRSIIVKQARPWVEKYPHIPAPWDRALVEGRFYQLVGTWPALAQRMPRLLGFDPDAHVLMLEDLGETQDCTGLYGGDRLPSERLMELLQYLVDLHLNFQNYEAKSSFANQAMRELNHTHLFVIPLQKDNGLILDSITPGLEAEAAKLRTDEPYTKTIIELGKRYLGTGDALLHGDYFPGSWLRIGAGIKIIDPEFCFFGPPEFDLGVFIAHLYLAHQSDALVRQSLADYQTAAPLNSRLTRQFAGMEIMRRLIGVAQLPLAYGLELKADLLTLSRSLVMS